MAFAARSMLLQLASPKPEVRQAGVDGTELENAWNNHRQMGTQTLVYTAMAKMLDGAGTAQRRGHLGP